MSKYTNEISTLQGNAYNKVEIDSVIQANYKNV